MSKPTQNNDGKLLFAIAGGIIVIAAGIAILASLGDDGTPVSQDITAMPAVRTDAIDTMVLPTSSGLGFTDPTASLADQVEDVDPIEPVFVIDPAADFVKEGIAAYESKRYDQARAYFAAETAARPGRAWTHYILALSQWKSGSAEDAADSMRRSLEIDATQVKAFVNLSRSENDRGEFDRAGVGHRGLVEASGQLQRHAQVVLHEGNVGDALRGLLHRVGGQAAFTALDPDQTGQVVRVAVLGIVGETRFEGRERGFLVADVVQRAGAHERGLGAFGLQ